MLHNVITRTYLVLSLVEAFGDRKVGSSFRQTISLATQIGNAASWVQCPSAALDEIVYFQMNKLKLEFVVFFSVLNRNVSETVKTFCLIILRNS